MTLHCFVVHHVNTTAKELNNDQQKLIDALTSGTSFNPDPSKQAQEVKNKKQCHPPLTFSNNNVSETSY